MQRINIDVKSRMALFLFPSRVTSLRCNDVIVPRMRTAPLCPNAVTDKFNYTGRKSADVLEGWLYCCLRTGSNSHVVEQNSPNSKDKQNAQLRFCPSEDKIA